MSDQAETSERANNLGTATGECLNLLSLSGENKGHEQVKYPKMAPHPGSFYHKVYSPCGDWTGIEGVVTLGQPHLDPKRIHGGVAQDTFSTYLGGYAKQQIDAGLSWEVTRDKYGKVDKDHKAWRPFWRNGSWHNAAAEPKFYWHPGDTVAMKLQVVAPNKLELTISDPGDHPKRSFSTIFQAKGFGVTGDQFFERVDSIDQKANEGNPVHRSHSHIDGTVWSETLLTTRDDTNKPLAPDFKRVVNDPPNHAHVTSTHQQRLQGGERVDIDAADKKK